MKNEAWDDILTSWRLAEAGCSEEALARIEPDSQLAEVIACRAGKLVESDLPVLAGWKSYYRAEYRKAREHFLCQQGEGWLRTWAELGMAKVASDCGKWGHGLLWCAQAWRTASGGEHIDLLSEISGARGEILLRAGKHAEAATAFTEDLALFNPGNRYRGRVKCYQAHAWSRMGPDGINAAKLAYRLSAHSPAESATNGYAIAGLALLGARTQDPAILFEALRYPQEGLPGFWILVARAYLSVDKEEFDHLRREALSKLPPPYFAERWWLSGWIHATCRESEALNELLSAADSFPVPPHENLTPVELPVAADSLTDAPWLQGAESWPQDAQGWWSLRDHFMP